MKQQLSDALQGTAGQLGSLIRVIADSNGITEEQAAAIGLLAELPERDSGLTRRLLAEEAFPMIISKVLRIRHGDIRGNRFVTPYLEGLVRVLSRITYLLENEPRIVVLAQEHNLTALFTDLLQTNGIDKVQIASAKALENLSQQSKHLTRIPEFPESGLCASIFSCFSKQPVVIGLCRIHRGHCSIKDSFCLLEGKAIEKLIACLDHNNESVVEAALAALCTLLDDGADIEQGVLVLCDVDGIRPILEVLQEYRTDVLRKHAVWAVERILRTEEIAYDISGDQNVVTALVEAFRHGDNRTKQVAERALKHVDKLPNFSAIYPKVGS